MPGQEKASPSEDIYSELNGDKETQDSPSGTNPVAPSGPENESNDDSSEVTEAVSEAEESVEKKTEEPDVQENAEVSHCILECKIAALAPEKTHYPEPNEIVTRGLTLEGAQGQADPDTWVVKKREFNGREFTILWARRQN